MSHVRSVSVGIWVDSGSRREDVPRCGISHFIEHMVFKGTATRSAEDIARAADALGGHIDAFTGKELVSFNTKVLDEHLPTAFEVLSDMVLRPAFRDEDIAKEKSVVLEELKMETDNPEYLIHETFSSSFWKDHPLGRSILGTKESINGFDRAMISKYYRGVYAPANLLITAAGRLSHDRLVELAAREFESLAPRKALPKPAVPKSDAQIIIRDKKALEQVHMMLGVPAYPVNHERRFAAYVLNVLLGGSMSSRLFQTVREQRGLAYAVFSEVHNYRDSGCLAVYAGTSLASVKKVVALVLAEFRDLKNNLLPAEELDRAKSHLKGSVMLSLESTSSRMSNLARQQLYFNRFATMDEVIQKIDEVTADHVQGVARDFFQPDRIALTVLGKLGGLKIRREELDC